MAPKKKTPPKATRCKVCYVMLPCWEHCQVTGDGKHEADARSAAQADESDYFVDYRCLHCHQGGTAIVDPKDIQWG